MYKILSKFKLGKINVRKDVGVGEVNSRAC